jgi:hypothetical protein
VPDARRISGGVQAEPGSSVCGGELKPSNLVQTGNRVRALP